MNSTGDEIEARDDRGGRWYHPRRRRDLMAFSLAWRILLCGVLIAFAVWAFPVW